MGRLRLLAGAGEDNYRGPWNAKTPNPILLINSRHDPNTGYANAVHAERYLGNAVLLTHEGYGHLSFQNPSACVDGATVDYLTELITPPRARSASRISSPSIRTSAPAAAESTSTGSRRPCSGTASP